MAWAYIAFFLTSISSVAGEISLGSSLSPVVHPTSWNSSSAMFAFGFYMQGERFSVGIWITDADNPIVVWTPFRDDPPVASDSRLNLTMDGRLLLITENGNREKVIASTKSPAFSAAMLDSGDFVLYDQDSRVIWESFWSPTDTILGGQNLGNGGQLISSLTETDHSSGRFRLKMQGDGNLVLYNVNTEDTALYAYWSSSTDGDGPNATLFLNGSTGMLLIVNQTSHNTLGFEMSVPSLNIDSKANISRATLDPDGVFRLYFQAYDKNHNLYALVTLGVPENKCDVKGYCGLNSFCVNSDFQQYCRCLPGSEYLDPNDWSLGCSDNFSVAGCRDGRESSSGYEIAIVEDLVCSDVPYFKALMSEEDCKKSCLEDCNCGAAFFDGHSCEKQNLPLRFIKEDQQSSTKAFIVVDARSSIPGDIAEPPPPPESVKDKHSLIFPILALTLGFAAFSFVTLAVTGVYIFKLRVIRYERLSALEKLGVVDKEFALRFFSYAELKRATNGFREELGKGAFGVVYKGTLHKGKKLVAVKRLEKLMEEGEKEFRAEMQAIGRTRHRNLVRLLGCCAEGSKRLLVYEFMSNGSLADLIFKVKNPPVLADRKRIALDVARGIHYLHEECKTPIIHCDLKPQNILMDDSWTAKISDFGLAKLLMPDQTRTFTIVRGTRGYMAPEWQKNSSITVKADVYSYGVVLLEIVCCRRNMEINVSRPEEVVLSDWVYKCFAAGELEKLVRGEKADGKSLEDMVKVGLWCIQDDPSLRPSMKAVVSMLEGAADIPMPPCPSGSAG